MPEDVMHPTVEELKPMLLAEQRARMIARCQVNTHFLGKLSRELKTYYQPQQLPALRSECERLLRLCIDRRDTERFPLWMVAGNHVAFGIKQRLITTPAQILKVCERYISRDDLNLEKMEDNFRVLHRYAMSLEEDVLTEQGENPQFKARFDYLDSVPKNGSMFTELTDLLAAREVDMLRSIAFIQSHILCRARSNILGRTPPDADGGVIETRKMLRHVLYRNAQNTPLEQVSIPVLAGCAYFEALDKRRVRPTITAFFEAFNPENPRAYLDHLSLRGRTVLFRNVQAYLRGKSKDGRKDFKKVDGHIDYWENEPADQQSEQ